MSPGPTAGTATVDRATAGPVARDVTDTRSGDRSRALVVILAALSAMAPLAIDMYVPAFPAMASSLATSDSAIQLSMTACLIGLVLGQLIIGPVSDSRGRRRPLLVGVGAFVVFSLVAAAAPSVLVLVGARFLQGFAGAAGMVIARAILSDRFHGLALAQKFALLSMVIGAAPVLAPVAGGLVIGFAPWRVIFVVLAVIGAALLVGVVLAVDESHPVARRARGGAGATMRAMAALLRQRTFMGYVLTLSAASAAMFAYISGSSFVFQEHYDVSSTLYSVVFAVNAVGMVLGSVVFGRLARRVRMNRLLSIGLAVSVAGAVVQVVVDLSGQDSMVATWVLLFVTQAGISWVTAGVMTIGQSLVRHASGAGSALLGGGQFILGAVVSPVVGLFGTDGPLPMAVIMLIGYLLAAVALVTMARPWRGHGEHLAI